MKRLYALLFLLAFSSNAFSELKQYEIDKVIKAPFSAPPMSLGGLGKGFYRYKGYSATDERKLIVYTASFLIEKDYRINSSSYASFLRDAVKGDAMIFNSSIVSSKIINFKGSPAITFELKSVVQEVYIRKLGIIVLKDHRLYSWSVQDFPGRSSGDGKEIYNKNLKGFTIL